MNAIRYFSENHTSKASQLEGARVEVLDSAAITELKNALADYPNDYNLHICLAAELGKQLRYREAIELLTDAIALEPQNPRAYRYRAPRYYSTLQFDRARADYSFCAAATPDSLDILYRLGITCVAMGDYPQALDCMERCITLTENDGEMRIAVLFWYLAAYQGCSKAGERENLAAAIYSGDIDVGHHFAYHTAVRVLLDKITIEQALAVVDDTVDDLDHSMILYGVYLWYARQNRTADAQMAMERLLARDFYWAGFAYIAALADNARAEQLSPAVPERLAAFLRKNSRIAVAFSGGVDSAYLLYAAQICGCTVKGYYAKSVFQPQFELDDARKIAEQLGVELAVLPLEVLDKPEIKQNAADRCYHCKRAIFSRLMQAAAADGFSVMADGTNASDDADDRPGMRALAELSVVSPLRECGITKAQLREYSRMAGLFTWNKPAYACLATRVPTGQALEAGILARVERGERLLTALGLSDLRLRVAGTAAKIQLPENQLDMAVKMRQDIVDGLAADFTAVLLDLKGRG